MCTVYRRMTEPMAVCTVPPLPLIDQAQGTQVKEADAALVTEAIASVLGSLVKPVAALVVATLAGPVAARVAASLDPPPPSPPSPPSP